jgi:uncharacterized phosphosugar-binding protein
VLSDQYMDAVDTHMAALTDIIPAVRDVAVLIARIVADGGSVFVSDHYGILDGELSGRASGLALFRSLEESATEPAAGDVLLLCTYHSADHQDLDKVRLAKEGGITVIVISPAGELADIADLAITNGTDPQNGVLTIHGIGTPFCPTSGLTAAVIGWMIVAETTAALRVAGLTPTVYWGAHLKGGAEQRIEAARRFAAEGY